MKTTLIAWSRSLFYMLAIVAAFGIAGANAQVMTNTISATSAVNTYTVAAGVTSVTVDMAGGSGGSFAGGVGGKGGRVQATLAVTPGQVLYICIGGVGANGIVAASAAGGASVGGEGGGVGGGNSGGSGGGAATSIRTSITGGPTSVASLNTRLLVAGGGGGGNYSCSLQKNGGAAVFQVD
ncbi:hypothetical protein CJD36_022285 [Flavipsychrobacter stenotrophus]|uniref:receptor protein-tyrosine kinase n=1 Tax=Flavipsychrobacter stenotrophus TaxID=2077091 RepID=A0A2S7SQA5_9BACT|nr:glycine-rich protein [Flavipsychrobacter stenotrophus]PQJ08785.1 hypothetical protein CJD36_022285 [Flavipsychrobacter stenotrophus]